MHTAIAAQPRCCQAAILSALLFAAGANGNAASAPQAAAPSPGSRSTLPQPACKAQAEQYLINVAFEPERGFLRAKTTVTLRAEEKCEFVELELNSHLEIKSVSTASGPLEFSRSRRFGSPKLSVHLAEPVPAGQPIVLVFVYEGVLPPGPFDYITKDGILLRDESRWYPAVDFSAFTSNHMKVNLPAEWSTAPNTEYPRVTENNGRVTYEWETAEPISSRALAAYPHNSTWVCAFILPYDAPDLMVFSGPSPSNCDVEAPDSPDSQFVKRGGLIELFFQHLSLKTSHRTLLLVIQGFPGARGTIGYSGPGFLVVSEDVVQHRGVPEFAPEFLPHELAHQWFPIAVTIEKEEDGWLAESIAEYLAWRYLQEKDPEAARQMVAAAMRDSLEPEPVRPLSLGLKLFALEPWSVTHATLYQRGMLVFRTLETVIDRERVDRALAEYYKRFAGKSASIADFRKICEEIAGRNLGWFFDYFLNGTRIPEIELRQVPSGAPGVAAGEIVVRNMPPEATVRVEMRIRTAKGTVDHSVATRGEVTPFSVNVPAPPLGIEIDPERRILRWTDAARRHRAQQALLRQTGPLEDAGRITRAIDLCRQALALDPEDAALNRQRIQFTLGRLELRLKIPGTQAIKDFQAVLDGHSIDPADTNFFRAWAHVYRGQIAKISGKFAATRAEANAGLALLSPALDERVAWPESPKRIVSAREELTKLLKAEKKK